jgi:hypothetical protein
VPVVLFCVGIMIILVSCGSPGGGNSLGGVHPIGRVFVGTLKADQRTSCTWIATRGQNVQVEWPKGVRVRYGARGGLYRGGRQLAAFGDTVAVREISSAVVVPHCPSGERSIAIRGALPQRNPGRQRH